MLPRHLLPRRVPKRLLPQPPSFRGLSTSPALLSRALCSPPHPDAPSFPCVDQNLERAARLASSPRPSFLQPTTSTSSQPSPSSSAAAASGNTPEVDGEGPEPAYSAPTGYQTFTSDQPLLLDYGSVLPSFTLAYETWGTLNAKRSNAILLHTGLSASSHAKSHSGNPAEGWWERFIGPGLALDTDKFFVVCTNVLGGCYGSTGPSSPHPDDGKPYATRFPVVTVFDMVRAQWRLMDHLGVGKLYASVGCSMGGMQSIAAAHLEPGRVGKVVSISGTARSGATAVAMRFAQRSVLMADPNWNRGFYYDSMPPHTGMKLARQIATITYRSGPEWEQRFGRKRRITPLSASESAVAHAGSSGEAPAGPEAVDNTPKLCPDFLIETYLDHQGEQFCLKYDANSLIYVSKAMDLFDMTLPALSELSSLRRKNAHLVPPSPPSSSTGYPYPPLSSAASPKKPYISTAPAVPYAGDLAAGLASLHATPFLILGVQSDILFPFEQQRELADALRRNGDPERIKFFTLDGPWGHDTFLIDTANVGSAIRGFLT